MVSKFGSLAFTARLIKSFGWLISLLGALLSTAIMLYSRDPYEEFTLLTLLTVFGLIFLNILVGVIIIAIGQLIECFLSIEENTRKEVIQSET